MDLTQELPRNETREVIQNATVAAFGLTFQGASHRRSAPPAPCQDYHALSWMEKEGILLAAIADGVGSCHLSHWGAYTAVNAALDSTREALHVLARGKRLRLDAESDAFRKRMKEIMVGAFRAAQEAVEQLADSAQPPQPVFSLQSTLTLAIYDGTCLYHGHAGDDGIVAQLPDGTVEMATRRMKGEEASSVYPLQSGEEFWVFGLVPEVSGFVMATDGVLDAFVQSHSNRYGIDYCNGICYAFMEDAMELLARKAHGAAEKAMERYQSFLQSEEYTRQVTDDLTLVAVVSPRLMAKSRKPDFDLERWNTLAQESLEAKRRALNHRSAQKPVPPAQTPPVPEEPAANPDVPDVFRSPKHSPRTLRFAPISILLVVLTMVAALLLGMLLGQLLFSRRHREEWNALSRQYDALSQDYAGLQTDFAALEQSAQEARRRAEEAEQALARQQQELEALRQRSPEPVPAEQTEIRADLSPQPGMGGAEPCTPEND